MIITSSKVDGEVTKAWFDGDKIKSFHAEPVDDILKANYEERKDQNNGWSGKRHFRRIARLSPLAYLEIVKQYPEILANDALVRSRAWAKALKKVAPDYLSVKGGV